MPYIMYLRRKLIVAFLGAVIVVTFILRMEDTGINVEQRIEKHLRVRFLKHLCLYGNGSEALLDLCTEVGFVNQTVLSQTAKAKRQHQVSTTVKPPPRCRIPNLDPFHRQALPYIIYKRKQKCTLRWKKSHVEKGVLKIDLENVKSVRLNYIKRINDEENLLSWKDVYNASAPQYQGTNKVLSIPLEDDFIKLDLEEFHGNSSKKFSEYHMYPLRKPPKMGEPPFKRYDGTRSKYNVLMIMLDSVSRACAQRYLKKTYRYLEENQNTVIMKGHTILGDGTTPQISALFFGATPKYLIPEGRKEYKYSEHIDSWPSILKDYKKHGYVTLHSEDQAWIGAFNFRLKGFAQQPTFKYLRHWWQRSEDLRTTNESRSDTCPVKYALGYLRDFYKEYSDELSFAYLANSVLSHNEPEKIHMFDEGFLEFFKEMEKSGRLNSTFVVLFGDHGMRQGSFRTTTQGQLEERLPLMTITVPPRFRKEHPNKFKRLKQNSKVLTTPYDLHVTLNHLLSLPNPPEKHAYGISLFSDIVEQNRACHHAGVPFSWCMCSEFSAESVENQNVKIVAIEMVQTINKKLEKNEIIKASCEPLTLSKIIRAGVSYQPDDFDEMTENYITYEIVFQVHPSEGIFEGTAEYDKESNRTRVNSEFSRINRYGSQPNCIAKRLPSYRQYCFCSK